MYFKKMKKNPEIIIKKKLKYVRIGKFEFTDAGKFEEVSERLWTRFVREGIRKNS